MEYRRLGNSGLDVSVVCLGTMMFGDRTDASEANGIVAHAFGNGVNFIEHPELIAQRIGRYAKLVGRENVIAGSDCGFGTWVGQAAVAPDVVWAKRAAMAEGARIASREFF